MAYIPPSLLSDGQVRALMFLGVLICLSSSAGLMAGQPLGLFTVVGGFFLVMGALLTWLWWRLLPECTGRSRRLLLAGAALAAVSAALLALSVWMFFNIVEDGPAALAWTIAVAVAGIACLIARIVVGVRRWRLLRRGPNAWRYG